MNAAVNASTNLLLSAMPADARVSLLSGSRRVSLERFAPLSEADQPIRSFYWLESGMASVVSGKRGGRRVEVAVIGLEGVAGTAALLGAVSSPNPIVIQLPGTVAIETPVDALLSACDANAELRALLLRYVQTLLVQVAGNAINNVVDRLDARLARWLLMAHDRATGDELALTHEFMAGMIGTQRSAVTHTLHLLEGQRMIRARRGSICVLDRAQLEEVAGPAYGEAESEYRRLIAPFGKGLTPTTLTRVAGRV